MRFVGWRCGGLLPLMLLLVAGYYLGSMSAYIAPLFTPDEYGYISVAAFLNGHDWQAVSRGMPWYSYGYSLLLGPVFAVTPPAHWYHAAQWVNVALIVALGICANLFLRKVDRQSQAWVRHVIVAAILLYPSLVFYARFAWAETLVAVMPWLLAWLLYRMFEAPQRLADSFLVGCLLTASYYVHARLIVFVAAGFCVLIVMTARTHRWREFAVAVAGAVVVFVPAFYFKLFLLSHLYGGAVSGAQQSPLAMLGRVWGRMHDIAAWNELIGSGAGQLAYLLIATVGIVLVGFIVCVGRVRKSWQQSDWGSVAALTFVLLGAAGCYVLVLMTMGMSPGYPHHVFYGRYTEPLVLPIVAIGLAHLYRNPKQAAAWMLASLAIIFALVPLGVHVARRLPEQTTYWTLITGLFTYRTPDWHLATEVFVTGFVAVAVVTTLAFRTKAWLGLLSIATFFFCAGHGLLRTYASAPFAHVAQWRAWPMEPYQHGIPQVIKLNLPDNDPLRMRGRVQVINAASTVIPANQWAAAFSGRFEQITWTGNAVTRDACDAIPLHGVTCHSMAALAATPRLSILAGQSLGVRHAVLPDPLRNYLVTLPYLRDVWNALALSRVTVRYDVSSTAPYGLLINVFPTLPGTNVPLASQQTYTLLPAGHHIGRISVPVPVRVYSGAAMPKGFYTLHVVPVDAYGISDGQGASIPMRIR